MGKDKVKRFQENKQFGCLHQPTFEAIFRKDYHLKGAWNSVVFGREAPICLELGCGKGEYTLALARKYPERHFIGIDIKGARLWRGAKTATEEALPNVSFLRTRIEFIESFFTSNEVDEIWITFPDPQLNRERKRLTHPMFLERYRTFLRPGATIHLKTDSRELHDYTCKVAHALHYPIQHACTDVYAIGMQQDAQGLQQDTQGLQQDTQGLQQEIDILSVRTFYEQQFLSMGKPITYLAFSLP